ncbi:hypothetical protein [Spirochaeta isovalerica]|uniref:Uncharacterized protein n=1 Tax=Spirochaeta isovalerica TaxID=150 RepID=A0A841R8D7_9SPIO|nr:hypothetical protein [Spirochaeta isovalerica]MBB6478732.1 hypothetical protein [Spirochaeta isovalerica]
MKKSGDMAIRVAEAINEENPLFPSWHSTVPFVFDGEILVTSSTVNSLWTGIVDSGFTIKNPVITSIEPVENEDFSLFRNSWEMEVFFKNKMPDYSYRVSIEGVSGNIILIIYRDENRDYSILGLKAGAK